MTTLQEKAPGQTQGVPTIAPPRSAVNVSTKERLVTGGLGTALALNALARRSPGSLLLAALGGGLIYRATTGYCPGYARLGIDHARRGSAQPTDYFQRGIHVEVAYTITKPADELYRFWRNFENLPRFMRHLQAVQVRDTLHSHWVVKAPAGGTVEWDAQIINDEPDRLIAWASLPGADVDNAGSVRFLPAPGQRGTEVRVVLDYIPPAGKLGSAVAWLFGEEPEQQIKEDLRHFKQLMEVGELPTTEGQPQGSCVG